MSKWGLSNRGLRPPSAICTQPSTIVHFCGPFGPLSKGNFRHKMTTTVGNRGQLWTSTLSPHFLSPHLDFPDIGVTLHSCKRGCRTFTLVRGDVSQTQLPSFSGELHGSVTSTLYCVALRWVTKPQIPGNTEVQHLEVKRCFRGFPSGGCKF